MKNLKELVLKSVMNFIIFLIIATGILFLFIFVIVVFSNRYSAWVNDDDFLFNVMLMYVLLEIVVAIVGALSYNARKKNINNKFLESKIGEIENQKKLYLQYIDNFEKEKSKVLGTYSKCYKFSDSYYLIRKRNDTLLFVNCYPPEEFRVEQDPHMIIDSKKGRVNVTTYDIKNILFWQEIGSLQYTSNVSGGGVNVGGAIAGAMIAGNVGAIIGSRESITTETQEHDSRKILMKMTDGEEKVYLYKYRDAFSTCIPEKEFTYVSLMNH